MKVLVPVRAESPQRTRSAIHTAMRLAREEASDFHVFLLSVQPKLSAHVAMYFPKGEVASIQETAGRDDLALARAMLDAERVPYTAVVRVGRNAQTIAEAAQEYRCHRVLLGEEESPGIAEAMFGSLAGQVREMLSHTASCKVIAP